MTITLADFRGLWAMTRDIDDALSAQRSTLTGQCRFSDSVPEREGAPMTLLQHETGHLQMPGLARAMEAERRYLWRAAPDGSGRIDVFFDDERYFHSFDPTVKTPMAHHDCAPDAYDVRYEFSLWPEWQVTWRVKGPRKDYVSVTRFVPVA